MSRTAEEAVVEAISLLPQYGSYHDVIPLAQFHTTEEMIRKYLCHDTLDIEQFGHLLPPRTRTQVCIECPLHWNSQDLCVACTVDRVERKWNLKLYLDAIAMHKEWYSIIMASDPGRLKMRRVLLEIDIRLWWLQERVAFIHMEVERLRELREYRLYFWDANEPEDVVFPPWISQFAGTKPGTRYDGRNAGYSSYLASWFR